MKHHVAEDGTASARRVLEIDVQNGLFTKLDGKSLLENCPSLRPVHALYAFRNGEPTAHDLVLMACELPRLDHKGMRDAVIKAGSNLNKRIRPEGYRLRREGRGFKWLDGIDEVIFYGRPKFLDLGIKPGKNVKIVML